MPKQNSDLSLITVRLSQEVAEKLASVVSRSGDQTEVVRAALEVRFGEVDAMLTEAPAFEADKKRVGELKYNQGTQRLSLMPMSPEAEARSLGHKPAQGKPKKVLSVLLHQAEQEMLRFSAALFGQDIGDFLSSALLDYIGGRWTKAPRRLPAIKLRETVQQTHLIVMRVEKNLKNEKNQGAKP